MAYVEPDTLLHGLQMPPSVCPDWSRESIDETVSLAKLWDSRGLLYLARPLFRVGDEFLLSRAFNCYKNEQVDRQIIDRRGRNHAEARLPGPSRNIPTGPGLACIEVDPRRETLLCSSTDRKDFYHQFLVTASRARANAVGPAVPAAALASTGAFARFEVPRSRYLREVWGDCLSPGPDGLKPLLFSPDSVVVCFSAIAQGDQLGVEFACESHFCVSVEPARPPNLPASRPLRLPKKLMPSMACRGPMIRTSKAWSLAR